MFTTSPRITNTDSNTKAKETPAPLGWENIEAKLAELRKIAEAGTNFVRISEENGCQFEGEVVNGKKHGYGLKIFENAD